MESMLGQDGSKGMAEISVCYGNEVSTFVGDRGFVAIFVSRLNIYVH